MPNGNQPGQLQDSEKLQQITKQIASLDNDRLVSLIQAITQKAGINPKQTAAATANLDQIKKRLAGLNSRELQQLSAKIKPEVREQILNQLKSEGLL